MNDLIKFLTSKEVIIVYIVALIACFLAFIIYLIDKSYDKRRKKYNTKLLNAEVATLELEENSINTNKDQLVTNEEQSSVEALTTKQEEQVVNDANLTLEDTPQIIKTLPPEVEPIKAPTSENLTYTTIEPNKDEALKELEKLTAELTQQEQAPENSNILLTAYEQEQEDNAIISLEELVKKSKEMYEANELTQYKDEGNEPISLQDLENKKKLSTNALYTEPFILENVIEEIKPEEITAAIEVAPVQEQLKLDDFNSVEVPSIDISKKQLYQTQQFHSSPVISPIYGIEKYEKESDLALENTANYEKLDEEIKKTNEFLQTLKELQKHLE